MSMENRIASRKRSGPHSSGQGLNQSTRSDDSSRSKAPAPSRGRASAGAAGASGPTSAISGGGSRPTHKARAGPRTAALSSSGAAPIARAARPTATEFDPYREALLHEIDSTSNTIRQIHRQYSAGSSRDSRIEKLSSNLTRLQRKLHDLPDFPLIITGGELAQATGQLPHWLPEIEEILLRTPYPLRRQRALAKGLRKLVARLYDEDDEEDEGEKYSRLELITQYRQIVRLVVEDCEEFDHFVTNSRNGMAGGVDSGERIDSAPGSAPSSA